MTLLLYVLVMQEAYAYQRAVARRCLPCAHIHFLNAITLYQELMSTIEQEVISCRNK